MANKRANAFTVLGLGASLFAGPFAPLAAGAILAARGVRAVLDKQEEEYQRKENSDMNHLPTLSTTVLPDVMLSSPSYPYIREENPLANLCNVEPRLGHHALITIGEQQKDIAINTHNMSSVTNSPVIAELMRNTPGRTYYRFTQTTEELTPGWFGMKVSKVTRQTFEFEAL